MRVKTKFSFGIMVGGKKVTWVEGETFTVISTATTSLGTKVYRVEKYGIIFELAAYEVYEI